MKATGMRNISCRIFKEQIELLKSLPDQEEAKTILFQAVTNALNQFENQIEFQNENQNENAYISVSESLSVLGNNILNLLSKNIVFKEFSSNLGGKRVAAGRKKNQTESQIDLKLNKTPGIHKINEGFKINTIKDYEIYKKEVGEQVLKEVQDWMINKKYGELVDEVFIGRQIINFSKRKGIY